MSKLIELHLQKDQVNEKKLTFQVEREKHSLNAYISQLKARQMEEEERANSLLLSFSIDWKKRAEALRDAVELQQTILELEADLALLF